MRLAEAGARHSSTGMGRADLGGRTGGFNLPLGCGAGARAQGRKGGRVNHQIPIIFELVKNIINKPE